MLEGGVKMDKDLMLRTSGLTKTFGSLTAVDSIALEVERGSIHGFVGPNGAGKTTTMKMLVGALRPTRGEGWIDGNSIGALAAKALIGYSPEHAVLYEDMTATDYLVYMAAVCGVDEGVARSRAANLLEWMDLTAAADRRAGGFSAGMRQRLGLAQALIHEPDLLILDEPTANMDPTGRMSILDLLRQLSSERGATILLSSHILSELEQVADSITMIYNGKIVVQGGIDEVRNQFAENQYLVKTSRNELILPILEGSGLVREAWEEEDGFIHLVGEDGPALRRRILDAVVECDADLQHLSREYVSLESVYRRTIGL
ncbi:MAG: ABC transporter ATP-binding protein [SAR202 cluster bacterium]|jgi:ABC-2 type transport system ATP-binding protein|nr:ABC transporter [Chloroflexota bacterium]MQG69682.1 ABC transporter ATP-binding protein [SAR202 cluster bacterium]HAL49600.1 ABC transporter ATP-binding protein [Dehalococcoidia bacterium]|tara:strand:- start:845 stop:1792 length:948 start_codon:yes stop_codon:yes gene_type:complete